MTVRARRRIDRATRRAGQRLRHAGRVTALAAAGAGFLLAVLWFDLMFDVQVRGHREPELPEPVLASIAGYYGRVTTGARPMNRLVATAMLATLAAVVVQIAKGDDPAWGGGASLALVVMAGGHPPGAPRPPPPRARPPPPAGAPPGP